MLPEVLGRACSHDRRTAETADTKMDFDGYPPRAIVDDIDRLACTVRPALRIGVRTSGRSCDGSYGDATGGFSWEEVGW